MIRTVQVAGYPECLKPYAVRVGAGSRLDCKYLLDRLSCPTRMIYCNI